MELSLGPVLYEWTKARFQEFYDRVADMDLDRVYIGEVVCARKRLFGGPGPDDFDRVAGKLERAGKKVVLSSLAVVSNEEELEATREICGLPYAVEANDMSILNIVDSGKKEIVAGPHITSYNVPSIDFLEEIGIKRVVFPVELMGESIKYNARHTGIETEIFAHGKVPLAFSWRCYTSRAKGLDKTDCKHDCARYPEGMVVNTVDGKSVFTVNGTSILSAGTYTLVEYIEDLAESGITSLRISPQPEGTGKVVNLFRRGLAGKLGPEEAFAEAEKISPGPLSNGWFAGAAGKDYVHLKDIEDIRE